MAALAALGSSGAALYAALALGRWRHRRLCRARVRGESALAAQIAGGRQHLRRMRPLQWSLPRLAAALRRRGRPQPTAPLQLFCDDVARRLRTGASLTAAVIDTIDATEQAPHAGTPHPVLVAIARRARVGEPLSTAARIAGANHADADVQLVAHVLAVAADHGGAPAEAIDRAASTLRERAALRAERHAQSASARLSTRVMTALPIAFTGFVTATDSDVRHILLQTPVGWVCLATGLALNLVGRAWARRLLAA